MDGTIFKMLLQKQRETPYIHVFKISSGEELIAKVTKEDEDGYTIDHPLTMAMGQRGLQFAPFMVMVDPDKSLVLRRDKVVADAAPLKELESQYESITTGIALPQKSSIITS